MGSTRKIPHAHEQIKNKKSLQGVLQRIEPMKAFRDLQLLAKVSMILHNLFWMSMIRAYLTCNSVVEGATQASRYADKAAALQQRCTRSYAC